MQFKLTPILDVMIELYKEPDLSKRFNKYLSLMQGGDADDMRIPISGYNPMAKQHVLDYLLKLKESNIEETIVSTIDTINKTLKSKDKNNYTVVLNVCDHIGGAWTQRFSTDYENKFKSDGLVKRKFCPLYFWVNEQISNLIIKDRMSSSIYRTIYQTKHSVPITLDQHIKQETFASSKGEFNSTQTIVFGDTTLTEFYNQHKLTQDHSLIFNFLYGDQASGVMGYKPYGIRHEESYLGSKILIES